MKATKTCLSEIAVSVSIHKIERKNDSRSIWFKSDFILLRDAKFVLLTRTENRLYLTRVACIRH